MNGTIKIRTNLPLDSFTYSWSTGANTDTVYNLSPGTYTVTVTHYTSTGVLIDSKIDTARLVYAVVNVSIFRATNPTCGANNGSIISTISGGSGSYSSYYVRYGVNYSSGFSLPVGLYQVYARDNITGCYSDTTPVILRDTIGYFNLQDSIINGINCYGDTTGSITIKLVGGLPPYRFSWVGLSSTDSFLTNLAQGTYTVNIHDSLCPTTIRTYSFVVAGPADTLKLITDYFDDTCFKKVGKIQLSSTGGNTGVTYYWTDGTVFSGFKDSLVSNIYYLAVVDSKGCTDSAIISIANTGGPSAYVQLLDSTCIGQNNGAIRIIVTSRDRPHHYTWSHDNSLDTNLILNLTSGVYTVTVTNANACDTVLSINVTDFLTPSLNIIGDTSILQGQSVFLHGEIDLNFVDSSYWFPSNNLVSLNTNANVAPLHTTVYYLYTLLKNGCELYDSVTIQVDSIPIEIRIPNIFTPNNDGTNDLFKITMNEAIRNIELHIYDRWGNNVFDSYDKNIYWDGINKYTQSLCEEGVYTYFIYIDTFANKDRIIKEGNISLIR